MRAKLASGFWWSIGAAFGLMAVCAVIVAIVAVVLVLANAGP